MQNLDRFLQELQESPEGRQFLGVRRLSLFKEIHEIVVHGKGGYEVRTVYTLPIWLRHYIYSEIRKYYKEEAAAIDNNRGGQTLSKTPKTPPVRKPDVLVKPRK